MRKKIVAGNWKMNCNLEEAYDLMLALDRKIKIADVPGVGVVIAPPAVYAGLAAEMFEHNTLVAIGAQNCSSFEKGAYTGETSAEMLASLGVDYCIIGHSERRAYFNESDEDLLNKIKLALKNGIRPIFCVGESLEDRKAGKYLTSIQAQMKNTIFKLSDDEMKKVILAYEPVWAIGTGETASPEQAQEVHQEIRKWVGEQFAAQTADLTPILYGGSCKPSNAKELFACADIDGGLIGGASLNAVDFVEIIKALG